LKSPERNPNSEIRNPKSTFAPLTFSPYNPSHHTQGALSWLTQSNVRTAVTNDPRWFAPFPNALGQRIAAEICQPCWSEWLQKQTQIINHYGLDLTNPDAQNFLFDNIKGFLFGDAPQLAQIDTSKEGSVKW
jgi:Fe-S cluster biosynthesis and repair protein YggX